MEFNQRITKVIEYSELSPAEFAEEIGVQRSSISHILSGRNNPSLDFITKVKSSFPELSWDWLINGIGEMIVINIENNDLKNDEDNSSSENNKTSKASSLPDLFSLINDESFGQDKTEEKEWIDNRRESKIDVPVVEKKIINDSQQLENNNAKQEKSKQIKQIVIFFSDGSFENYQN